MNQTDRNGARLLLVAVEEDNLEIIELLIECKTDTDIENRSWTPFLPAVDFGSAEVAQQLLEGKADVNPANTEGATPLGKAIAFECLEVVELLLECKANANLEN